MNEGLSTIKNIIWALAIAVALLALLVGLVFAISNKFYGERESGTMTLSSGSAIEGDKVAIQDGAQDEYLGGVTGTTGGTLSELPGTQDAGLEYVFNLAFLCDSTISGINDFSTSFGGTATAQLWTDSGTGLPASTAADAVIVYPADNSQITPANAAMVSQPKRLVIYIGGDDLASATQEGFIAGYTALIQGIQQASPSTTVVCCSLASVSAAYTGTDGLTPALISQANEWIKTVCSNTGTYYADLASTLNDSEGYLSAEYASADGRKLNTSGINKLMEYFRMHAF